jgi:hypothetical protein
LRDDEIEVFFHETCFFFVSAKTCDVEDSFTRIIGREIGKHFDLSRDVFCFAETSRVEIIVEETLIVKVSIAFV